MTYILSRGRRLLLVIILGGLVSCASGPKRPSVVYVPVPAASNANQVMERARSRWIGVDWSELPGWEEDASLEFWPALLRGCERPARDWERVCADALQAPQPSSVAARTWLMQRLQPWRVEALDGVAQGLLTGYYEPLLEASRVPRGNFRFALFAPPPDLGKRKPYWTRQELETSSAAQRSLRGRELAYLADPVDALILQIQGSGRLQVNEPDGSKRVLRMAFGGHNDQPYRSVGRWLIEQGELGADQASWPAIKAWAQMNPNRVQEMLWSNPRVVFFREELIVNPGQGPRGAQGVPLTPGRSIAVDAQSIPYGTPVWLDSIDPMSRSPLRRLAMAQDTGSAITGAVRADYFAGWGWAAEQQAGSMKQPLRLWALWPKS